MELLTALRQSSADLESMLSLVVRHFEAQIGTLHTLESDGQLHLRAHTPGIPEPVLNASRVIPVGKGIAGQAVQRRAPVNLCNLQTDSSGHVPQGARATAAQGAICVPLLKDEQALGALGIAVMKERVFTPEEEQLLLEAGRVVAQSL